MKFSGFMNVYQMDDMSWKYIFGEKSHTASNLKDLEFLVRIHGLKWSVLDKDLAQQSLEEDKANNSGFLNVYRKGDYWHYRGSDLKSPSRQTLQKNVLKANLEWKETDSDLAYKNWKLDLRKFS